MEILIDSEIRNWVFIPIILALLLFSIIRQNVQKIIASPPSPTKYTKNNLPQKIESSIIQKSKKFQNNTNILPLKSFQNRQTLFCQENSLLEAKEALNDDPLAAMQNNPMSDPSVMGKMLKGNMMMMVLFPLQMFGINYFFSGMIVGKVAFPLTQKFRELLQKGIEISNIDVKYISSLSLYFLVFMGIDKIFKIFFKSKNFKKMQMGGMAPPPMNPMGGGGGNKKVMEKELGNIKTLNYEFAFEDSEEVFLEMIENEE